MQYSSLSLLSKFSAKITIVLDVDISSSSWMFLIWLSLFLVCNLIWIRSINIHISPLLSHLVCQVLHVSFLSSAALLHLATGLNGYFNRSVVDFEQRFCVFRASRIPFSYSQKSLDYFLSSSIPAPLQSRLFSSFYLTLWTKSLICIFYGSYNTWGQYSLSTWQ